MSLWQLLTAAGGSSLWGTPRAGCNGAVGPGSCIKYFFVIVVVFVSNDTKATARRTSLFVLRTSVNYTVPIAVGASFHVRLVPSATNAALPLGSDGLFVFADLTLERAQIISHSDSRAVEVPLSCPTCGTPMVIVTPVQAGALHDSQSQTPGTGPLRTILVIWVSACAKSSNWPTVLYFQK
jgi:hypothetical protein